MQEFYYSKNDQQIGPVSIAELKNLGISKDTLVWCEGFDGWKEAGNVPELAELFKTMPPPLPINSDQISLHDSISSSKKENDSIQEMPQHKTINKQQEGYSRIIIAVIFIVFIVIFLFWISSNKNNYESYQSIPDSTSTNLYDTGGNQLTNANNSSPDAERRVAEQQAKQKRNQEQQAQIDQNEEYLKGLRNTILDYLKIQPDWRYRKIGGISDASVTVYNNTSYTIDNIIIRVQYIKNNGDVYDATDVYGNNLPPNSNFRIDIPSRDRGTEIRCLIWEVKSQEMNLCYTFNNMSGEDLNRCN